MRTRFTIGKVTQILLTAGFTIPIFYWLDPTLQPAIRGQLALFLGFILMAGVVDIYLRIRYGAEASRTARFDWGATEADDPPSQPPASAPRG